MRVAEVRMLWVQAAPADFCGTPPSPRSGHTAAKVGKSLILVFGGLAEKKFLNDLIVYDIDNKVWFEPKCSGLGTDGHVGPTPRAFHVAVTIDCHMFIYGGRSGRKRLGDFWMLDTDIWQWTELTGFGDLPSARDFAAGVSVGNGKVVLYGGWDGSKWLSDVYVLDTISLEWRQMTVTGPTPLPRCGHTATMVEKRLLIFGGRGGGGPIMGDLWALKGLFDEENAGWTQLKLPGQVPSPRCGHTITSGGTQLLVFGGHGTGGWLTRYDIYFNDCIILDRASVQWKRLSVNNHPPSPRAYHSMTRIASRFLLIGGYDGKNTFGDLWWLVSEDDPTAKRALLSQIQTDVVPSSKEKALDSSSNQSKIGEQEILFPSVELRRRLGLSTVSTAGIGSDEESEQLDKELLALGSELIGRETTALEDSNVLVKSIRDHWSHCDSGSIHLKELGALLRDYQRLVAAMHWKEWEEGLTMKVHRFYHLKNSDQLRIDDIPALLSEYRKLSHLHSGSELW